MRISNSNFLQLLIIDEFVVILPAVYIYPCAEKPVFMRILLDIQFFRRNSSHHEDSGHVPRKVKIKYAIGDVYILRFCP